MKTFIFMLAALIGLVGCRTKSPEHPVVLSFHEQEIYASLKKEPVPLPRVTPYDADSRQRQFFMDGFRAGWDCAISGALLHGTFGTPPDLADDVRKIWAAGWKSGAKTGSERWQGASDRGILLMLSMAQRETRQGTTSTTLQEMSASNTERTNWPTSSKATFFRISDWNSVEAELGKSFEDDVENPFKRSKLFKQIKSGHDQQMFIEMTMQSDYLMVPLAGFLCLKEQSHEEVVVKTAMCIILESKHPASPANAPIFEFLRTRKDMALSNAFTDLATRAGTNVNLTILLSVLSNDWLYDWFHNIKTTLCSTAEATVLDELIGRSQKHNQKLSPKMIAELNKMQFVPGFPRAIFVLYSDADKPILMTNLKSVLEDQSINDATMLALIARKRDLIEELLLNDSTLSQQARTRVEQFLNKIKKH